MDLFFTGVFIIAAKRTPFGTYGGVLKDHSATDLAEHAAKAALAAGGLAPEIVNSVIIGNVMQVFSYTLKVFGFYGFYDSFLNIFLCVYISSEFSRCSIHCSSRRFEVWSSHPGSCSHREQAVWFWFSVHHQRRSCTFSSKSFLVQLFQISVFCNKHDTQALFYHLVYVLFTFLTKNIYQVMNV